MVSVWRSPCDPVAQQYDAETHVIALRPLLVTVVGVVATDHATPLYCSMRAWSVPVELDSPAAKQLLAAMHVTPDRMPGWAEPDASTMCQLTPLYCSIRGSLVNEESRKSPTAQQLLSDTQVTD
jgi:hypothetical protein